MRQRRKNSRHTLTKIHCPYGCSLDLPAPNTRHLVLSQFVSSADDQRRRSCGNPIGFPVAFTTMSVGKGPPGVRLSHWTQACVSRMKSDTRALTARPALSATGYSYWVIVISPLECLISPPDNDRAASATPLPEFASVELPRLWCTKSQSSAYRSATSICSGSAASPWIQCMMLNGFRRAADTPSAMSMALWSGCVVAKRARINTPKNCSPNGCQELSVTCKAIA